MPTSHRTLGAIGAAVGVAAAGMIVLLATTRADEEPQVEPARPTVTHPEIPKTLPAPPKPSKVVVDTKVEPKPVAPTPKPIAPTGDRVAFFTDSNRKLLEKLLEKSPTLEKFRGLQRPDALRFGRDAGVGVARGTGAGTALGGGRMGTGIKGVGTGRTAPPPPPPDATAPPAPRPDP